MEGAGACQFSSDASVFLKEEKQDHLLGVSERDEVLKIGGEGKALLNLIFLPVPCTGFGTEEIRTSVS